jgi:AraC family transcriptional regulator
MIMIEPRIEILEEKRLAGRRMMMSFANNTTRALWQEFMPLRKHISNAVGNHLYSVEIYPVDFFIHFDINRPFEKWAAVELKGEGMIPEGLEILNLPEGLYAVFLHRGPASEGPKTYEYIFQQWLPDSMYSVDSRPHFALMGEKYKHEDPASEEEIWIPVRRM